MTLFHWDFPYELYLRGGWLNRDSVEWFGAYTDVVVRKLSDRVTHWMTLNEPVCFVRSALEDGIHAPGDKLGKREVLTAAHHALMAHGRAVQAIRGRVRKPPRVGWAPCGNIGLPATNKPADIRAAKDYTHDATNLSGFSRRCSVSRRVRRHHPPAGGYSACPAGSPPDKDGIHARGSDDLP